MQHDRMQYIDVARNTGEHLHRVLQAIDLEQVHNDPVIQQHLHDLRRYLRPRNTKKAPTRVLDPADWTSRRSTVCQDLTRKQANFISRVTDEVAAYEPLVEQQIFASYEFQRGETSTETLFNTYSEYMCLGKTGLRILALLIDHDIDQYAETCHTGRVNAKIQLIASAIGKTPKQVSRIEIIGRFYMDLLEHVALGGLAMLGNHHTQFGEVLSGRAKDFAECCNLTPQFEVRSKEISGIVLSGILHCAKQCNVDIKKDSRLHRIVQNQCAADSSLVDVMKQFGEAIPEAPEPQSETMTTSHAATHAGALQANQENGECPAHGLQGPIFSERTPLYVVGDGEPTIPTVENESLAGSMNQALCSLVCAFGRVPLFLLNGAASSQSRWNEYGVEGQIDLQHARLDADIKSIFISRNRLCKCLQTLTALGVLERLDDADAYICTSASSKQVYCKEESRWVEQAFCLFCYVCPRSPVALPSAKRKALLTVLDYLLQSYARLGMKVPSHDEAIETLVAASNLGQSNQRRQMLSFVRRQLHEATAVHLQADAIHRLSASLRLEGNITASIELISDFVQPDIVRQLHGRPVLGLLYLSQAANHAYRFDFASADNEARKWNPPVVPLTDKHHDVIWDQIHSAGKILRGQGDFIVAQAFLERCVNTQHEHKRCLALSHYADNCIEVDYLHRKTDRNLCYQALDRVETLINPEIQRLWESAPHSKGLRRLLLCMSEIHIRRGRFSDASVLLEHLCGVYAGLHEPDIVDRLGHIRTFIALARICSSGESETRWVAALELGRKYHPLEEDVFTVALIQAFICSARVESGDREGGRVAFDQAVLICRRKTPQFVIPGVGTYLFDEVRLRIRSATEWVL